jgi:hypothetical protein
MKKLIRHKLSFVIVLSALLALSFAFVEAGEKDKCSPGYGPPQQKCDCFWPFRDLCGDYRVRDLCGEQLIAGESNTIPISMHFQAGSGEWKQWPSGGMTIHSGVGYIEPFGAASYSCGIGYPEAANFPKPNYMIDPSWTSTFSTNLFCVYLLDDGWIIAYDGVMGNLKPSGFDGIVGNKMDQLINVVVGGTGAYAGAVGMWVGHTEGWGEMSPVGTGSMTLPKSLFKILKGYIKLPQ